MNSLLFIFLFAVISNHKQMSQIKMDNQIIITVIYDNYSASPDFRSDWGFSCLIEGKEKTILFDTGTNPDIFRDNLEKLEIDLRKIDMIVISHNHGDHTGGLPYLIRQKVMAPLYIPFSVKDEFSRQFPELSSILITVTDPVEICDGVYLTGEMGTGIKEQSLILETEEGLVIITGCSHPGIQHILHKTKEISEDPIHLVMGGFHMLNHSTAEIENIIEQFIHLGVIRSGPTHCTGDKAIQLFKKAYKTDFFKLGSGRRIFIPPSEQP